MRLNLHGNMRIAIISDIHEDFQMLEKAMRTIKSLGYDMLVCLGDITGFAPEYYNHKPNANACIDLLREYSDITLAGNHDLFSSQRLPTYHLEKNIPENWYELTLKDRFLLSNNSLWLYEEEIAPTLTPENELFLRTLDEWCTYDDSEKNILFSHFLQPDIAGIGRWFPYRVAELKPHFKFMAENSCRVAFVGHCHPNGVTLVSKIFWSSPNYSTVRIKNKSRIVLCPPIVESDRKNSGFLVYDSSKSEITPYFLH